MSNEPNTIIDRVESFETIDDFEAAHATIAEAEAPRATWAQHAGSFAESENPWSPGGGS